MKKNDLPEEKDKEEKSKEILNEMENINAEKVEDKTEQLNPEISIEEELEKLKNQLSDSKDKYLRLFAEFDNFKKRNSKERMEWMKMASAETIISLLPVLDDLERGKKQIETAQDIVSIKEGFNLISSKLSNILENKGLKPMESIGKEFSPELHDAISEVPSSTEEMKGKVVDEIERGYYLNDNIIRHAKVVVGK